MSSLTSRNIAAERLTVLLVEDSPHLLERLSLLVTEELGQPARILTAPTGAAARHLFHTERPDAVVLDLQLPDLSGLDLLAEFKAARPTCRVIVLTNHTGAGVRRACARLAADGFLVKAHEFDRVPAALRSVLS
jgi:two-component system response regulator DesR